MTEMLKDAGVGVGAITELEESMGIVGVFDPNVVMDAANELTEFIRIARGEKGDLALVEEFSHFVEVMMRDSIPMQRLYNILRNNPAIVDHIFETEGTGTKERYEELYKNDPETMLKEAMGKMLARAILKNEQAKDIVPVEYKGF